MLLTATLMLTACSSLFLARDKDGMTTGDIPVTYASGMNVKASFNYATPIIDKPIQLTAPYYVEVRNDSLISYLPYFGRADYVPYGGGKALDFAVPILRIDITHNEKKQRDTYYIEVQTDEDYHFYELQLYSNGRASLDVRSRQRDLIRFEGYKE